MLEVGSLDSWLLSAAAANPSIPGTPFAVAAYEEPRRPSTSEPVPIPQIHRVRSSRGCISDELHITSLSGLHRPSDHGLLSCVEQSSVNCHHGNGAALSVGQINRGLGCELEGTVRRGRKVRSSKTLLEQPGRSVDGNAESLLSASGQPLPTDGQLICLGVASSLPAEATQAPVSLTSLCTALSTPAAAQQVTLASAKPSSRQPDPWVQPGLPQQLLLHRQQHHLEQLDQLPGMEQPDASRAAAAFPAGPSPAYAGGMRSSGRHPLSRSVPLASSRQPPRPATSTAGGADRSRQSAPGSLATPLPLPLAHAAPSPAAASWTPSVRRRDLADCYDSVAAVPPASASEWESLSSSGSSSGPSSGSLMMQAADEHRSRLPSSTTTWAARAAVFDCPCAVGAVLLDTEDAVQPGGLAVDAVATAVEAPRRATRALFGATRRGLYEGTVREGGPRNAWRYCFDVLAPVAVN